MNKQAVLRGGRTPEHCLKLERWQGLPHINKVKQCKKHQDRYEKFNFHKIRLDVNVNNIFKAETGNHDKSNVT